MPRLKTPEAVNDFLYVDDTAEALVVLVDADVSGVFNIGSGVGTPVGAIADRLLQLAGCASAFGVKAGLPVCGAGFWADTSALRSLGWSAKTPLDEGLSRTLAFFRDNPTHAD